MVEPLLSLSRVHFPVSTLGPGKRVAIWFQGCSRCCHDCISPDTWEFFPPTLSVDGFVNSLDPQLVRSEGITITGGEPLKQPDALYALVRLLKERHKKSIFLFTGYTYPEALPLLNTLSPFVDAAMCGSYDTSAHQTLALRGSDNQTLHCLTPQGEAEFSRYERSVVEEDKRLDVMFDENGTVWFAGIPQKGDIQRLQNLLEAQSRCMEKA